MSSCREVGEPSTTSILYKKINFSKSNLGENQLWGNDLFKFSLPNISPHYGRQTGEKKISYLNVEYVIPNHWALPSLIETKTKLYIWDSYERCNVKSGLIIKSISNSWNYSQISDTHIPYTLYPIIPLPYTPSNHRNWNTCNEHGMVTVLTHHPLCVHLES